MEDTEKPPVNDANNKVQASRVPRLKQPPRDLAEWIRLANLIRPGSEVEIDVLDGLKNLEAARQTVQTIVDETGIPEEQARQIVAARFGVSEQALIGQWWPFVLESVARLDDPLRSELLAKGDLHADWTTGPHSAVRATMVLSHAATIIVARDTLRILCKLESEPSMNALEALLSTLRYADLSYLRRCAYEKCGIIFYAGKVTQFGCTPEHSSNIRKKNKRDRDRANRRYKASKKKRATKARKR